MMSSLLERVRAAELEKQSLGFNLCDSLRDMASRMEAKIAAKPKLGRKIEGEFTIPSTGERSRAQRNICTFDVETNPFDNQCQELIVPFCWDYYDGLSHTTYYNRFDSWEAIIAKFFEYLDSLDSPQVIFAHNGGKFDFTFLTPYFDRQKMLIINGRLVSAWRGKHQFRDSYAMLPVPLAKMEKEKFDYELLRENRRWEHIDEICAYLRSDTENLYKYVSGWIDTFGIKPLTMASAAMSKLNEMYSYTKLSSLEDAEFRRYYAGGRVECFQANEIAAPSINVYDVNSMYPYAMSAYEHPIGNSFFHPLNPDIDDPEMFFAAVQGESHGALPLRDKEGLSFPHLTDVYHCSAHELRVAIKTGAFKLHRILKTYHSREHCNFFDFIDRYYNLRMDAKASGDDMYVLFWKLVMNSAYGKFAQNPEKFREQHILQLSTPLVNVESSLDSDIVRDTIRDAGFELAPDKWSIDMVTRKYVVVSRKPERINLERSYRNVATAASITGSARAMLFSGISQAKGLIYCDTDSLICESLSGVCQDSKKLGAWKLEASGNRAYVVGKKTYALYQDDKPIKHASKGVRLEPDQIRAIALRGEECEFVSRSPSFNLAGEQQYISRTIRNTVKVSKRPTRRVVTKQMKRSIFA